MEGIGLGPALPLEPCRSLSAAIVRQQLEGRTPLLELHLPIQHHSWWEPPPDAGPILPCESTRHNPNLKASVLSRDCGMKTFKCHFLSQTA